MNEPAKFNNAVSSLWAIANLTRGEGVARTVNECCRGTGGRLTFTKEINPQGFWFAGRITRSILRTILVCSLAKSGSAC